MIYRRTAAGNPESFYVIDYQHHCLLLSLYTVSELYSVTANANGTNGWGYVLNLSGSNIEEQPQ